MAKLIFGKNDNNNASVKEAFEAAKAARVERTLHDQAKRAKLPSGHEAGKATLDAIFQGDASVLSKGGDGHYTGRVIPKHLRGVYSRSSQAWKNEIGKALDVGTPIVTDGKQADELFHTVGLKKDATAFAAPAPTAEVEAEGYKAYKVACLTLPEGLGEIDDAGNPVAASATSIQVPVGRKSPFIEEFVEPFYVRSAWGNGRGLLEKRYTKSFIKVKAEGTSIGYVLRSSIYRKEVVDIEGYADEEYYVLDPFNDKEVIALKAWERRPLTEVMDEEGNLLAGVLLYKADDNKDISTSSNGEVKRGVITFYCRNLPGFDWQEISNKINFGLPELLEKEAFAVTKPKDAAQMSTRLAQSEAPAVEGRVALAVEAYYMGIFADVRDGEVDIVDEYVARWLNERGKGRFLVLPEAVRGMSVQCRPHLTKGAATVRNPRYIAHLAEGLDVVYLYRDSITEEQQREFDLSVHSKGRKGKYAGKLVVILPTKGMEEELIEFIADLNGLKTFFRLETVSYLNALSVSEVIEETDDGIKTSIQTASTYFSADYIESRRIYDELNVKGLKKAEEDLLSDVGKAPSIDGFHDATNWSQVISQVAPSFGRKHYYPLWKQAVEKRTEGLVNSAARLNLKSNGAYCMFVPDTGIDFGHNFLKDDGDVTEVYWSEAEELGHKYGILVRFPKAHAHAYSYVRFVTKEELFARAEAVLEGKELYLYKDAIGHQHSGVLMCPAVQSFMDRHDGADFDGDHGQLELDPEKVEILHTKLTEGRNSSAITVHITEDEDFVSMAVELEEAGQLREGFVDDLAADLAALAEFQTGAGKKDDAAETQAAFEHLVGLIENARSKEAAAE